MTGLGGRSGCKTGRTLVERAAHHLGCPVTSLLGWREVPGGIHIITADGRKLCLTVEELGEEPVRRKHDDLR